VASLVKSWISQPDPKPEIAGDRCKAAPSLRRYRRARSLAALLRPATPPPGTRPAAARRNASRMPTGGHRVSGCTGRPGRDG